MNKKSTSIMIFIFIIIVMFFLLPKSCGQARGDTNGVVDKINRHQ
jgi:hypothetical protein